MFSDVFGHPPPVVEAEEHVVDVTVGVPDFCDLLGVLLFVEGEPLTEIAASDYKHYCHGPVTQPLTPAAGWGAALSPPP